MANRKILANIQVDMNFLNLENWPPVFTDNLTAQEQNLFYRRKKAVELYLKNEITVKEICQSTQIEETELRRFVKRCFTNGNKGAIWGFSALIPKKRLKNYQRINNIQASKNFSNIKMTGLFGLLLDKHPEIREKIMNLFFENNKDAVSDPVIKLRALHSKFIQACKMAGLTANDYPFYTENLGRISLYRFLKKLENEYFYDAAKRHGEDAARRARSVGIGTQNNPLIVRPFERVQFDGHKIDLMIEVTFTTPEGDEIAVVIDRIWILVIIDVATRVILGHYLSLNREYTSSDVLQCIKNAVKPKSLKKLSIPGLHYPESGGFSSIEVPEAEWGLWEEFLYDNGKANLADLVKNRLIHIVDCSVNAGPVNMPERRGIIERFFGILEENGYHRLPSTTGNNPLDPRRRKPEEKALKYNISAEEIEELTDVLIANYNITANAGVNYLSPISCMKQRIARGMFPRTMKEDKRHEVAFLTLNDQRVIKGNIKNGKRPYVYYEGVEYRSDVLSKTPDLIGEKLDLLINIDDLRTLRAFLPDGSEFGILTAVGKWGIIPHTLQLRKQIIKLKNNKEISYSFLDDPIHVYQLYLENKAITCKKERNRLVDLKRYKTNKNTVEQYADSEVKKNQETLENNTDQLLQNLGIGKNNTIRKVTKTIIF